MSGECCGLKISFTVSLRISPLFLRAAGYTFVRRQRAARGQGEGLLLLDTMRGPCCCCCVFGVGGRQPLMCGRRLPCAWSGSSSNPCAAILACRDFVMSTYQELKKANPKFPVLIREASGIQAKMVARYGEAGRPASGTPPHPPSFSFRAHLDPHGLLHS